MCWSASAVDAVQLLSVNHLKHLRALGSVRRLVCDPTPRIVMSEEFRSKVPRHATERAAVLFDVELARDVARVWAHVVIVPAAASALRSGLFQRVCGAARAVRRAGPGCVRADVWPVWTA